ncbi:hypothetical protein CEXT_5141 [Caerostris extrusa]|uniref:Uncharacterized protein n=1 Tax=Caerostris extrusa TaxID=172846 RepID=A0AAV4SEY3_CAEEX|nr:hypothetical protein CEXT_5141 [Caerostris extrusa]
MCHNLTRCERPMQMRAGMEGAIADLVLYKGSEKTTMPEPRGCYNGVSILWFQRDKKLSFPSCQVNGVNIFLLQL